MKPCFEKYYTVRLFFQNDPHFRPTIIEISGEYDTYDEAMRVGQRVRHNYDWYNITTGEICNRYQIQVQHHYKAVKPHAFVLDVKHLILPVDFLFYL